MNEAPFTPDSPEVCDTTDLIDECISAGYSGWTWNHSPRPHLAELANAAYRKGLAEKNQDLMKLLDDVERMMHLECWHYLKEGEPNTVFAKWKQETYVAVRKAQGKAIGPPPLSVFTGGNNPTPPQQ